MTETNNKLKAKNFSSFADEMRNKCPGLSRYYMFKAQTITKQLSDPFSISCNSRFCLWCGSLYSPENVKVRLLPKIPQTSNLKKLLKRYFTNPHSLGKFQSHLIARYLDSRNKLLITCQVCKKSRKIEGQQRKPVQLSKIQCSSASKSVSMSESFTKLVTMRLKKKKVKATPEGKNIPGDSPLLTSTPVLSNLSMSSNNSKWESNATPSHSKSKQITPATRKKSSKKMNNLRKLFSHQKIQSEDSLTDFLQSVS